MGYGIQTATIGQMTFLGEEHTTKPKPASVSSIMNMDGQS